MKACIQQNIVLIGYKIYIWDFAISVSKAELEVTMELSKQEVGIGDDVTITCHVQNEEQYSY